jgi:hypothetical protein
MDRIAAAVNKIPMTPSVTAGYPGLVPGTMLNSETAIALVNARRAAADRTCRMAIGLEAAPRLGVTDRATNSRPVSEPAVAATAVNRSR